MRFKIYFWDGSEFKNSAAPCCEVHIGKWRVKLLVVGKRQNTIFYKEEIKGLIQ